MSKKKGLSDVGSRPRFHPKPISRNPRPIGPIRKARFRTKITPCRYDPASQKLGTLSVESFPGSNDFRHIVDYFGSGDDPFSSAESCMDELHGSPPYEVGGPFRKIKIEPSAPQGPLGIGQYYTTSDGTFTGIGSGKVRYSGGFAHPTSWPGLTEDVLNISGPGSVIGIDSALVPSTSTLDSRVWDQTKPKIENGGLAVAIAEIRDVPHMLHTSAGAFATAWNLIRSKQSIISRGKALAVMSPKKAADHFLNHNFGWVPFIKDLTSLIDNVIYVDRRIDSLMQNNGDWVRRKAVLVNNTTTTLVSADPVCLCFPGNTDYLLNAMTGSPRYEITREKWSYAYGVGRFKYYLPYLDKRSPESQGMLGPIRRQLALHGARLTPANVYKATPWTWLFDWITDSGHVINAINDWAVDGLVAKYLFLVHHQILTDTLTQYLPFNGRSGGDRTLTFTRLIEVKQRKEAESPFGFGLHPADLSPKQLAILAALGITHR